MNDRAQGGTADVSKKAQIELMQQRRLSDDDNKGVDEPLNETDKAGNGIIVTANYKMQIFNWKTHKSLQRQEQLLTTNPIQTYFAFDFKKQNKTGLAQAELEKTIAASLNQNIEKTAVTYRLFPLAKNKVLLRVENLADRFDENINGINDI